MRWTSGVMAIAICAVACSKSDSAASLDSTATTTDTVVPAPSTVGPSSAPQIDSTTAKRNRSNRQSSGARTSGVPSPNPKIFPPLKPNDVSPGGTTPANPSTVPPATHPRPSIGRPDTLHPRP